MILLVFEQIDWTCLLFGAKLAFATQIEAERVNIEKPGMFSFLNPASRLGPWSNSAKLSGP